MLVATGVADEASIPVPFLAWSPDERRLLYRSGGIDPGVPMVASLGGAPPRPLLPDSVARGLATFQNSLAGGPAWSPDGRRIAFLAVARTDRAYALQVYVVDVESGRLERWTGAGRARFSVAWSPNGRWLAYTSGALGGGPGTPPSTVELLYAPTGMARSAMLVASDSASLLRDLRWSPDGALLLAQDRARRTVVVRITEDSASPGVVHGMRVPHALPRRAFAGWLPGDLAAGAPAGARGSVGSLALLTAVPEGMSARLAAVSFPSGRVTLLTGPDTLATAIGSVSGAPRDDAHARGASGSHSVVAYRLETGSLPSDIWVADLSTDAARSGPQLSGAHNVTRANPWLEPPRLPRTRIVRWISGDPVRHDTLEGQLLEPRGARPARGWPLVVVPYGDYRNEFPKSEYFLDRGLLPLVAAGYAVVRPNTRGIATDSRDDGEYGRPQLEDTERLLEKLVTEGSVDPRRVAVIGHSHGGAMAYYYLTHATPWRAREARGTSRFCAVVAVNGRADWVLQGNRGDGVLPEGLGGTPAERPEVYRLFSPAANARSAVAPLLAVAGGKDTQILPANVPIMADSMRTAGRKVETLVFPEEGHLLLAEPDVRQFWDRTLALLATECGTG
jgi:dipeptidyl aminopeptidase/acylaminoacyl peptidase